MLPCRAGRGVIFLLFWCNVSIVSSSKKEIEKELASVEPVIAAARSAVGDIKPESLSEVSHCNS